MVLCQNLYSQTGCTPYYENLDRSPDLRHEFNCDSNKVTYIKIDGDTILLSNIVNSFPNDSVLRNACIEVTEFSTFVIDVGFEFWHSSFLMNAGSQILITTSDIAQFSSNTFRGDIYMWRG